MEKNIIRDLKPKYEKRKSYYGKATLRYEDSTATEDGTVTLVSYDTDIIKINSMTSELEALCEPEDLSNTTLRHLREFLKQCRLGHIAELTKKEIIQSIF